VSTCKTTSGSIGIGAMIVFIALILVAAVASTIIIKTIEDLQQSAENTSSDTKNELSNKVLLESAYITFAGSAGCTATLYQHSGFGGWSATYTVGDFDGTSFLDPNDDGLNEAISNDATTIKVDEGCEIIMYDGPDFSGWSARLGGGDHELADINANSRPINCGGSCNDQISSIKVLGFEVEMHMKLAAGSNSIYASDISWTATCDASGSAGYDAEDIVFSGSSLIDGTNTAGIENNFISSETIEIGMMFKVETSFKSCSPEDGDNIPFTIHVNGGATTYNTLPIRSIDIGTNILFSA
jgi:hypothetical protein